MKAKSRSGSILPMVTTAARVNPRPPRPPISPVVTCLSQQSKSPDVRNRLRSTIWPKQRPDETMGMVRGVQISFVMCPIKEQPACLLALQLLKSKLNYCDPSKVSSKSTHTKSIVELPPRNPGITIHSQSLTAKLLHKIFGLRPRQIARSGTEDFTGLLANEPSRPKAFCSLETDLKPRFLEQSGSSEKVTRTEQILHHIRPRCGFEDPAPTSIARSMTLATQFSVTSSCGHSLLAITPAHFLPGER